MSDINAIVLTLLAAAVFFYLLFVVVVRAAVLSALRAIRIESRSEPPAQASQTPTP